MTTKVQAEFLAAGIISDQTQVSAADADHLLIFDASDNSLKKALVSTISGGGGSSAADDITAGDAAVTISTSSGNITIDNGSSDDDIIFKGTDGGSDITALTLDMSEAGKATFNGDVAIGDNKKLLLGAGDDLQIYHDGNNSIISDSGTGGLFLRGTDTVDIQSALGHNYLKSTISAGTQIYHNNTEKFATVSGGIKVTGNIENASGDMTLDVAGSIILDADNNGEVSFQDAGTEIGKIFSSSSDFAFEAGVQDKDILFRGNDGGTGITALTLDMSEAGTATFNHDIQLADLGMLRMGAGGDLILLSDGTNGTINTNNGALTIDSAGNIDLDADSGFVNFKDGGTTIGYFENSSNNFVIRSVVSDADMIFTGTDGGSGITALTLDMSEAGAATFNNNVTAYSDERLKDNIETIENGLDKVEQLRGVTYTRD